MKNLLLFACLLITSLAFNQTIVIQVNEVQSFYGDPTWSIEQVVNDPYFVESPRRVDCKYIINFNNGVVELYKDGEMIEDALVQILTQDGVSIVKFLVEGFDAGLIIDLRVESESITYYLYGSSDIEYMKFTDFQINRPS
jgi:hypothetical protein